MSTTFDQVTSLPVNSPPPGRGRPGYSKEDVIRIAVQAFNEHGYEATSMGALAKKLQISKSAIYHHVSSKEEILEYAINPVSYTHL